MQSFSFACSAQTVIQSSTVLLIDHPGPSVDWSRCPSRVHDVISVLVPEGQQIEHG